MNMNAKYTALLVGVAVGIVGYHLYMQKKVG